MRIFAKETNITPQIELLCSQSNFSSWSSLRLLCATINSVDDGAAEAAKALRKALRDKSALRQMNAITIIQGLVEGCRSRFIAQLATNKFVIDLSNLARSKETNPQVKLYLLERLASWASVCSTDPGLGIIPGLYNNLVYDQVVPFYDAGAPTKSPISDHITRPNVAAAQCNLPTLPLTYAEVVTHTVLVKNNCRMLTEIVTFTDPDTVGKDEFKLIQEFKKSVMALQRDTQMYLNEATSRSDFDAVAMSQLLYANEDIVNSIKCYNDLMEKLHVKHSLTTSRQNSISTETQAPLSHQTSFPPTSQHSIRTPLDEMQVGVISDDNGGAGVGSGYIQDTSDLRSGKATMLSTSPLTSSVIPTVSEPALNPFADDSYYVTESESDNIATTIRNGKRPIQKEDPITKVEEDLIQLVKAHSLTSANRMTVASSSSSSSSTAAAAGSTAVVSS